MSLSDIKIYRSWPIINGFVQVPNNLPRDKTRVTVIDALTNIVGSDIKELTLRSGPNTGSKHGSQRMLILPPVAADQWYASDPKSLV